MKIQKVNQIILNNQKKQNSKKVKTKDKIIKVSQI